MMASPAAALLRAVNRAGRRQGRPFDPATTIAPPHGARSNWVHYGVMVPGLPEPHRTFGVMAIVGTPGLAVFANDHAITTTPRDTAYLVSATGAMTAGAFHTYSIRRDCEFAPDGSRLRFGDDLLIEGGLPSFHVRRRHPEVDVDLDVTATDKVTYFVDLPGGLYTHWSVLCEYRGTVGGTSSSGLCTFEYAHGAGVHTLPVRATPNLPSSLFTYHVLNVDERTQLLLSEVRGPRGAVLFRTSYVRGLDEHGREYPRTELAIDEYEPRPLPTPSGRPMRVPAVLRWSNADAEIEGRCHGDWSYGLGAGFVGSYAYEGTFRGRPVHGTAYLEWVDLGG